MVSKRDLQMTVRRQMLSGSPNVFDEFTIFIRHRFFNHGSGIACIVILMFVVHRLGLRVIDVLGVILRI